MTIEIIGNQDSTIADYHCLTRGCREVSAGGGREAIEGFARSHDAEEPYHHILIMLADINNLMTKEDVERAEKLGIDLTWYNEKIVPANQELTKNQASTNPA